MSRSCSLGNVRAEVSLSKGTWVERSMQLQSCSRHTVAYRTVGKVPPTVRYVKLYLAVNGGEPVASVMPLIAPQTAR